MVIIKINIFHRANINIKNSIPLLNLKMYCGSCHSPQLASCSSKHAENKSNGNIAPVDDKKAHGTVFHTNIVPKQLNCTKKIGCVLVYRCLIVY